MTPLYKYEKACQRFETLNKAKLFAQSKDGVEWVNEELDKVRQELYQLREAIKRSL